MAEQLCDNFKDLNLETKNSQIQIRIEEKVVRCDKQLLVSNCHYFKAFQRFRSSESDDELVIKGGLNSQSFLTILAFLNDGNLRIDLSNFQQILEASLFLQCGKAEEETISFISQHLSRENAFREDSLDINNFADKKTISDNIFLSLGNVLYLMGFCSIYYFSKQIYCERLVRTCVFYLESVFSPVFLQVDRRGRLETFLEASSSCLESLVTRQLQCPEEVMFYAVIGWTEYKQEERRALASSLLSSVDFRLFSQAGFDSLMEDTELLEAFGLTESVTAAKSYRESRLDRRISWWTSHSRSPRWPEMVVVVGGSSSAVLCCPLSKFPSGPSWRSLTKKPAELRRRSTGTAMVYRHPRLYFLGGERNWSLHWFDLELNKWGVERGLPPGRLLAGGCVVGAELFLLGGVTVEEWEGVRGGAGGVTPSPALDVYSLTAQRWSQADSLRLGRSSPGVVSVGDRIWMFGGLRRRQVLTSCCSYQPSTDQWTDMADLPEQIAYFSLVTAGHEIWIVGGFGQDYTCRTTTYCYNTHTDTFSQGPRLNKARKGAFSFLHDNCIYVCGGSVDGMRYLDTIEVMSLETRDVWTEQKLNINHFNTNMVSVTALIPVRFL